MPPTGTELASLTKVGKPRNALATSNHTEVAKRRRWTKCQSKWAGACTDRNQITRPQRRHPLPPIREHLHLHHAARQACAWMTGTT